MENNKLQKEIKDGVQEIQKIKMTSAEGARVLENILNSSIQSPYTFSFISIFNKKILVYSGSALCLLFILSGGAVFASGTSLPGNILYPLKVKVIEPVRGAFIASPFAKVEYENNLATKRLVEAETLADKGELDKSKEEQLNSLLEKHTKAFNEAVDNFHQREPHDKKSNDNDDLVTNFQANMNAHARILNIKSGYQDNAGENQDTKISKTAKDNAKQARENFKDEGKKDQEENGEDTHERLLDSQSSAKEAEILFKAGLGF